MFISGVVSLLESGSLLPLKCSGALLETLRENLLVVVREVEAITFQHLFILCVRLDVDALSPAFGAY